MELLGLLLPPFIDVLNKDVHDDTERYLIALIVSIVLACIIDWQAIKDTNLQSLLSTIAIISAESQLVFKLVWQRSKPQARLQQMLGGDATGLQG